MGSTSTSSISVPLCDPKANYLSLKSEIDSAIKQVLDSGVYVMGKEVRAFEEEWAAYCDRKYAVAVGNGTEAIYLVLKALRENMTFGMVSGNKVLTTPFTFWATTLAILQAGLRPEFIDIDPLTGNVPDQHFAGKPAVMVPHWGMPGKWTGVEVIEDRAHAHGSKFKESIPKAECYSFYPTKNLGAIGQAGAIVTDDEGLAQTVRRLREYGETQRFVYGSNTGNHRMDELQAAILRVKLPHLDQWNERRRNIARLYLVNLRDVSQILLPNTHPNHVYHIFGILAADRDDLSKHLAAHGVQNSVRYPLCCHEQPGYPLRYLSYKNAENWARTNLTLPMYPEMTVDQVDYVSDQIIRFYRDKEKTQ